MYVTAWCGHNSTLSLHLKYFIYSISRLPVDYFSVIVFVSLRWLEILDLNQCDSLTGAIW